MYGATSHMGKRQDPSIELRDDWRMQYDREL